MIQEVILTFSDDSVQTLTLRKTSEIINYDLIPVITSRITVEVKSLFTFSDSVGGSFNFLGYPCLNIDTGLKEKQVLYLFC
jgi:hypothetical protein